MPVLPDTLNTTSEAYAENRAAMLAQVAAHDAELAKVLGGEALVALLLGALALAEHDLDHGHALARRLDTT